MTLAVGLSSSEFNEFMNLAFLCFNMVPLKFTMLELVFFCNQIHMTAIQLNGQLSCVIKFPTLVKHPTILHAPD